MNMEHLSERQIARAEALGIASTVGRTNKGVFGGSAPPDVYGLVDLAEYIVEGTHPLHRDEPTEGVLECRPGCSYRDESVRSETKEVEFE